MTTHPDFSSPRIAILGGGPGGYEAAMVAASLGAKVTIIERAGLGGSAVLTDVVPSKTLIATADLMTRVGEAGELGVKFDLDGGDCTPTMRADLKHINDRLLRLARQQSADIQKGLENQDVRIMLGSGRMLDSHTIEVLTADGTEIIEADAILLVGSNPRTEAPVLNARIRGNWRETGLPVGNIGPAADMTYPVQQLGAGPDTLANLASTSFMETLRNAERPMIIVGQGALARPDGAAVLAKALELVRYGFAHDLLRSPDAGGGGAADGTGPPAPGR